MTNSTPPQDPREQRAGVDADLTELMRSLDYMRQQLDRAMRLRDRSEDAPLEVEQYAVCNYGNGHQDMMFLEPDGTWTPVRVDAAIFNDFNVARLIAVGVGPHTRVETRRSFHMPMPV